MSELSEGGKRGIHSTSKTEVILKPNILFSSADSANALIVEKPDYSGVSQPKKQQTVIVLSNLMPSNVAMDPTTASTTYNGHAPSGVRASSIMGNGLGPSAHSTAPPLCLNPPNYSPVYNGIGMVSLNGMHHAMAPAMNNVDVSSHNFTTGWFENVPLSIPDNGINQQYTGAHNPQRYQFPPH